MPVLSKHGNTASRTAVSFCGGEWNFACQDFVGCVTGTKLVQFCGISQFAGEVQCQVPEQLLLHNSPK